MVVFTGVVVDVVVFTGVAVDVVVFTEYGRRGSSGRPSI